MQLPPLLEKLPDILVDTFSFFDYACQLIFFE